MEDALFARPTGVPVALRGRPATGPGGYLDDLERDLGWGPAAGRQLALELTVGLGSEPLDRGHDLGGYLFPVVGRLGPVRFDAAFAAKVVGAGSAIVVAPAVRAGQLPPPQVRARITESATGIGWKEQLHAACRRATPAPAPPGPVSVQIRLTLSRRRNWIVLWQPAVDSLGPILGVPDPTRPYLADGGRIAELGLHRRLDDTVGHRVGVEIWWHPTLVG